MVLTVLKYILVFVVLFAFAVFIADRSLRSKQYRGPESDHFNGSVFFNIKAEGSPSRTPGFREAFRMIFSGERRGAWEHREVEQTKPAARIAGTEVVATFINHATVLVQTEGLNIITDPIYSKRASPFSFVGPARYTDPGVAFDDLPKIDVVLISHNHYDHLDLPTLKRIIARDNPRILVPLGNTEFLERHGITTSIDLDWWQQEAVSDAVSITSVPAQHFSSRSLSDRNKTLWSGYVIQTPQKNIYFAGDTGYGPFADQIAEHFPNGFDLGLLPIGAFLPTWFMQEIHTSPDEAIALQEHLKIRKVMGIHFGAFRLASDGQDDPAEQIHELTTPDRFMVPKNGESLSL